MNGLKEGKKYTFKRKLFGGVDETEVLQALLDQQKAHEIEKKMIISHYTAIIKDRKIG